MSASALSEQVDRILYEEWDPIGIRGVAPRDEYRSYVAGVVRLIETGAGIEQIAGQLRTIRAQSMGLRPRDEHDRAIATRLVALR